MGTTTVRIRPAAPTMPASLKTRAVLLVALVALGWRVCASLWTEADRVGVVGIEQRARILGAGLEQRYRWTLRDDYPIYAALAARVAEAPRVVLYGAATGVPREDMGRRLLLLENQLRELLFPAKVASLVGPIPAAALPAPTVSTPRAWIVNVTPAEPVPDPARVTLVERGETYSLWRAGPP